MNTKIKEIISYLSFKYGQQIHSYYDKEDLKQDLIEIYLRKNTQKRSLNQWFVIFKNYLIGKMRRSINERRILKTYRERKHLDQL